jgi:hypothetical protein
MKRTVLFNAHLSGFAGRWHCSADISDGALREYRIFVFNLDIESERNELTRMCGMVNGQIATTTDLHPYAVFFESDDAFALLSLMATPV